MTDIIERLRIESRREPHEPIWQDAIDEIEALRAEVERLRSMTAVTLGVGSGDGNLFVHGDYDSIKAVQSLVFRAEQMPSGAFAKALLARHADPQTGRAEPVKVPSDAISVVGMPEFDALIDHIYEYGTVSEGVIPLANAFAKAVLARHIEEKGKR